MGDLFFCASVSRWLGACLFLGKLASFIFRSADDDVFSVEVPVGALELGFESHFKLGEVAEFPIGECPGTLFSIVANAQ